MTVAPRSSSWRTVGWSAGASVMMSATPGTPTVGYAQTVPSFSALDGALKWGRQAGGAVRSGIAVAGGAAYFGCDDHRVYALDAASGGVRRTCPAGGPVRSGLAVYDGKVFAGSGGALCPARPNAKAGHLSRVTRWRAGYGDVPVANRRLLRVSLGRL